MSGRKREGIGHPVSGSIKKKGEGKIHMKKVIIEARVNEYAMRDMNPNVPWTVQELVDEAQRGRLVHPSCIFTQGQLPGSLIITRKCMLKS